MERNPNWFSAPEFLFGDWDYDKSDGTFGLHTKRRRASGLDDEGFRPVVYVRLDLLPSCVQHTIKGFIRDGGLQET